MKWLEIIEFRSADQNQARPLDKLDLKHLSGIEKGELMPYCVKVYRHDSLQTDWSIHLHYQAKSRQANKNHLGQRLTATLKEIGYVNSRIWIRD